MLSYFCFALSALCFAAMFSSRKKSRPAQEVYTYYVGDDEPLPTWQRKHAPMGWVAERVG